jgi:hypothetical protein
MDDIFKENDLSLLNSINNVLFNDILIYQFIKKTWNTFKIK